MLTNGQIVLLIECMYLALGVALFPDYPIYFMLAKPISIIDKASKKDIPCDKDCRRGRKKGKETQ